MPKPREGESKKDYMSRCMGESSVRAKHPDQGNRYNYCSAVYDKEAFGLEFEAENDETYTHEWEAFATGKWNGTEVTRQHLDEISGNFRRLASVLKVPLKLGHNEEKLNKQQRKDGEPALGWIADVWVNAAGKLMVKATDIPKVVYEAIQKKLYRTTSIEAMFDVEYKGEKYGTVLTAVALLGVDLPAVNTLEDLQAYMTSDAVGAAFSFASRVMFTQLDDEEGSTMPKTTEELMAEIATMKAERAAEKAELEQERLKNQQLEFTNRKAAAFTRLEKLVKDRKCTPGTRDKIYNEYTQETANEKDIEIGTLEKFATVVVTPGEGDPVEDTAKKKDGDADDSLRLDDYFDREANKLSAKFNVSYNDALKMSMAAEPEKAREFVDMKYAGGQ